MSETLVYCAPWHIEKSASARDIFIEPLRQYLELAVQPWGENLSTLPPPPANPNVVFWQVEPPEAWLKSSAGQIVWVPMWDAVEGHPAEWWHRFPPELRIVAFSKNVARFAKAAGLKVFSCQYFADPAQCPEARWEGERVAFYWNRRGLYETGFLRRFCKAAGVDRLLYRNEVDPICSQSECGFDLGGQLGRTVVEPVAWMKSRHDYNAQLNRAHIFIAPRSSEGVGIAFLEAMARGCAVVAFCAPTMNEYIESGNNGVLVPNFSGAVWRRMRTRLVRKSLSLLASGCRKPAPKWQLVSATQDWSRLARMDYRAMGGRARADHLAGFSQWQKQIEGLARFVAPDQLAGAPSGI